MAAPALAFGCSLTALDGFSEKANEVDASAVDASDAAADGGVPPPDAGDAAVAANALFIERLSLIDTTTKKPVMGFDPIPNNAKLPLSTQPNRTIEAITSPRVVGSVVFEVRGVMQFDETQNNPPYTINDATSTHDPWPAKPGVYAITVRAFPGANALGQPGPPVSLSFEVE